MHKGPLAYAEAFLEPNKLNIEYSKELKSKFKTIFKKLIEFYQKGIDLYKELAIKLIHMNEESLTALALRNISSSINTSGLTCSNMIVNSSGQTATIFNQNSSIKHFEMSRLLQEKFNELENNFRNLLLIDGVILI